MFQISSAEKPESAVPGANFIKKFRAIIENV
jgi:hypothetical protein